MSLVSHYSWICMTKLASKHSSRQVVLSSVCLCFNLVSSVQVLVVKNCAHVVFLGPWRRPWHHDNPPHPLTCLIHCSRQSKFWCYPGTSFPGGVPVVWLSMQKSNSRTGSGSELAWEATWSKRPNIFIDMKKIEAKAQLKFSFPLLDLAYWSSDHTGHLVITSPFNR